MNPQPLPAIVAGQSGSQEMRRVSVVFVVGSGRSGTTLLDTILGNHCRICGAGELALLSEGNSYDRFYCPCGTPVNQCVFWSAVLTEWFRRTGLQNLQEHGRLRQRFEGPRLHGLSRLLRERLLRSRLFDEYAFQTSELYRTIRDISGKETVVDSSVIPMRALALSLMPDIDLRLIHIIRDCRGVAWSLKRGLKEDAKAGVGTDEVPRPVSRSALTWAAYNLLSTLVCRGIPMDRSLFCRYEDLVTQFDTELRRIGAFLNRSFDEIIYATREGKPFRAGCTFGGNRMRMNKEIHLRLDRDWVNHLSQADLRTLERICGSLMTWYGYSMSDDSPK